MSLKTSNFKNLKKCNCHFLLYKMPATLTKRCLQKVVIFILCLLTYLILYYSPHSLSHPPFSSSASSSFILYLFSFLLLCLIFCLILSLILLPPPLPHPSSSSHSHSTSFTSLLPLLTKVSFFFPFYFPILFYWCSLKKCSLKF